MSESIHHRDWRRATLLLSLLCVGVSLSAEPIDRAIRLPAGMSVHTFDAPHRQRALEYVVPAPSGIESLVFTLALDDPLVGLALERLIAPDGTTWHDQRDGRFDSRIAGTSWGSAGELAVSLPLSPSDPLQAGDWQLHFRLDEPVGVRRAAAVVRLDVDKSARMRVIDIAVGIATADQRMASAEQTNDALAVWRGVMDRALKPHALQVGRLEAVRDAFLADYASLDPDEDSAGDACRTLYALVDAPLSMKILLVDRFESVDPESVDGTLGFSPQPGSLFDPDSSESCAFVALEPFLAEQPVPLDLDDQIAATLLHEAGHFMGLDHISEADGLVFDRLADTAECRIEEVDGRDNTRFDIEGFIDGVIDDFECGAGRGVDNLMFWSGVAQYAPFVLSDSQAWVLRRHPLMR